MVPVKVGQARAAAVQWVRHHGAREADFEGAFFAGSTVDLPDTADLRPGSDVDIQVVIARPKAPGKLGKFAYHGVLLDVSYVSAGDLAFADEVLASYHLAPSLRRDGIIADPSGGLRRLHETVRRDFAKREWVRRRCEDARRRVEQRLRGIDVAKPFPEQVMAWLFGAGVTCHVLLVAALQNPTVRLRYVAAREVLAEYDHLDLYADMLDLLGSVHLTRKRVQHHIRALAETFDATVAVSRSPFFFSTDITPVARHVAVEASFDLVEAGHHREAMFWIVATFARCHTILIADAPRPMRRELAPAFEAALTDLGITSAEDILARAEDVLHFVPRLWGVTEKILLANPDIRAG
jgi:hypothetical protein